MKATMYDYIIRQPQILETVFERQAEYVTAFADMLKQHPIETIVFTGSGTSHHVSLAAAALCEKYLPVEARAPLPMQFLGSRLLHPEKTLVVGISQSGNSLSCLQALKYAKEAGCPTLAFSLEGDSVLVSLCDAWMPLVCERELVPPETQGYTAAILEWILAVYYAAGISQEGILEKIRSLSETIEMSESFVRENQHDLARFGRITVTASGLHYPTALEGTLKIRETCRKAVLCEETEELSHVADLAYEDDDSLMALVQTDRDRQTVELVRKITNRVFCFGPESFPVDLGDDMALIHAVVPFQMTGALVAEGLGVDTSRYPYDIENISHGEDFLFR